MTAKTDNAPTALSELRRLAREGLEKRLEQHPDKDTLDRELYRERLEKELRVIAARQLAEYFLIVQDFINWGKDRGIPVGPGYGATPASLAAWALRITNLDPIAHTLLFERFLNNERFVFPEIFADFCCRRRPEVIRHIAEKYGEAVVLDTAGEAVKASIGPMKFRLLHLRTLTVIQDCLDAVAKQGKEVPNLDLLPLTDAVTYKLFAKGDTKGVWGMESSGMRQYLRLLKPSCFEDLTAMLALYRPNPLRAGMMEEFIRRKRGELPVTYPLPILEDCLRDTYGLILYPEQMMRIAQIVAGYTLEQADLLRANMVKQNVEAQERAHFVDGAGAIGIKKKKANEIYALMEKFVPSTFPKAHVTAYALISYHSAYLKTHFRAEFMAALDPENRARVAAP